MCLLHLNDELNDQSQEKEPGNNNGGIMMDHSALQLAPFTSGEVVAVTDDVQAGIDDVFFYPRGSGRPPVGHLTDAAYDAVDHRTIEPIEEFTEPFGGFDKHEVIQFVDIVFVEECPIDAGEFRCPAFGSPGLMLYR